MILGAMQPYFMPYIGYFQLMKAVDKYVIFNDGNYIRHGWVARNYILMGQEKRMFILTLQGASSNRLFMEIQILDNFVKLRKTLETYYAKAPFFKSVMELMNEIFSYPEKRLDLFIKNSFELILSYLDIKTELLLSSELHKDTTLKGKYRAMEFCHVLNADTYYNAIGGQELYDKNEFKENGISLYFVKTNENLQYKQFSNTAFVPNLSMIDVLMFNSPEETNLLLDQYQLV